MPTYSETAIRSAQSSPEVAARLRVMDILAGAFLLSALIYGGIHSTRVIAPQPGPAAFPPAVWLAVVAASVAGIAPVALLLRIRLGQVAAASSFAEAAEAASKTLVMALAFGDAPAVLGLISPLLGAPREAGFGLIGLSFVMMAGITALVRPRVRWLLAGKWLDGQNASR